MQHIRVKSSQEQELERRLAEEQTKPQPKSDQSEMMKSEKESIDNVFQHDEQTVKLVHHTQNVILPRLEQVEHLTEMAQNMADENEQIFDHLEL